MVILILDYFSPNGVKQKNKKKHENLGFKDTHREKAPLIKTTALTKSTNMGIWVVCTTNQLFIRDY